MGTFHHKELIMFIIWRLLTFLSVCWSAPSIPDVGVDLTTLTKPFQNFVDPNWSRNRPGYRAFGNQVLGARGWHYNKSGTKGGYNTGAGVSFMGTGFNVKAQGEMRNSKDEHFVNLSPINVGGSLNFGNRFDVGYTLGGGISGGYDPRKKNVGGSLSTPMGSFGGHFGCETKICLLACVTVK